MTIHRIRTLIRLAIHEADKEIRTNSVGFYGSGTASEGYVGGYRDALNDVILITNDICPYTRNFWQIAKKLMDRANAKTEKDS